MPDQFTGLPLSASEEAAELQTLLRLPLPADWRGLWTTPGQYCKLTIGDHRPGFFVIANAPSADHLEILIKEASPLTAALRSLPPGSEVQVTPPAGPGFPADKAAGREVLLLAAGSGIAAMRPLIQHFLDSGTTQRLHLIYGERTPQRLAFTGELAAWMDQGIEVITCLSAAEHPLPGQHAGYVQDCLKAMPLADPAHTMGYLCGMESMLVACREVFAARGGDPSALYTNF